MRPGIGIAVKGAHYYYYWQRDRVLPLSGLGLRLNRQPAGEQAGGWEGGGWGGGGASGGDQRRKVEVSEGKKEGVGKTADVSGL
eukprot:3383994-Rhodomonas_salina.2